MFEDSLQRIGRHFIAHLRHGRECARIGQRADFGVHVVCVSALLADIEEEPRVRSAAFDDRTDAFGKVIGIVERGRDSAHPHIRLHGAGPVDQHQLASSAPGGLRRGV